VSADERVSIRAHFERFPASIKGAFVLRGADRDPHQVRIFAARVREVAGGKGIPIGLEPATLEVAPNLDLFVPFEFPITELAAGWYGLECDVAVDGSPSSVHPGKRFAVPWPRATVRRGTVAISKAAQVGSGRKIRIEQLECGPESMRLTYSCAPPEPATIRLAADGEALPVLDAEFDEATGRGRVLAYPLLKARSMLTIDVRGVPAPIEVRLP